MKYQYGFVWSCLSCKTERDRHCNVAKWGWMPVPHLSMCPKWAEPCQREPSWGCPLESLTLPFGMASLQKKSFCQSYHPPFFCSTWKTCWNEPGMKSTYNIYCSSVPAQVPCPWFLFGSTIWWRWVAWEGIFLTRRIWSRNYLILWSWTFIRSLQQWQYLHHQVVCRNCDNSMFRIGVWVFVFVSHYMQL